MQLAKTIGFKAVGEGNAVTDEQLAKINGFALVKLTAEQVYVRKYLMAHNGIDRDTERFNEDLLENFAKTLPGKGFFVAGHPSSWSGTGGPGEGKFFNSFTEEMTPAEFKSLTGEEIKLPEGVKTAKVLWGEAYILKQESNQDLLAKIDAGIYSFVSIGFNSKKNSITDDDGNHKYGEYGPGGEAREGSLVWLGAQPGASAKSAEDKTPVFKIGDEVVDAKTFSDVCKKIIDDRKKNTGGNKRMTVIEKLIKQLTEKFSKAFTEDSVVEGVVKHISEKNEEIARLTPLAKDGESYRKSLSSDAVKYGVMIGEIEETETAQKSEENFYKTLDIDRLKLTKEKFETKAREKFPDKFTIESKDVDDKAKTEAAAAFKNKQTTGKKDYSSPEHNELFETVGK